jgi:tRNA 2-selenouridine synthase
MPIQEISIADFLALHRQHPVLDVRSPLEYQSAHLPGAISFPLFSDEERKVVGTAYKKESREKAIKIGLGFFGPKMVAMVETAEQLCAKQSTGLPGSDKTLLVHCWRGGMRSAGVAWLLGLYGFNIYTLKGGYKMFRRWVLSRFELPYPFKVIGGYTGSGKTRVLRALKEMEESVIDLEALANHKGSAFGCLGEDKQPTQEMFENRLAIELDEMWARKKEIWIEDESRRIGDLNIPSALFTRITTMPLVFIDMPFEERLAAIIDGYGKFDKTALADAVLRIKKRLGPNDTKSAIDYVSGGDIENGFRILLKYYDKQYAKSMEVDDKTNPIDTTRIRVTHMDDAEKAKLILNG